MTTPNIQSIKHIHFIGIGGAGMNGIAEVLITQGYQVSGSDLVENAATQHLKKLGATIQHGHNSANINGADVVVYSSMVPNDNPEIIAARQKNIPVIPRAQMLAELMRVGYGIAVAGTHGKTTTTSLVTTLLNEGDLDPTYVIGGLLRSADRHARWGSSKFFVAEADESDGSFLFLYPKIAIVTNIDADHLNNYGDFGQLRAAFVKFLHRLPEDGFAILCSDDLVINEILPQIQRPLLTYGFHPQDDICVTEYHQEGVQCYIKVQRKGKENLSVQLNMPGRHNVLNALAAIAVAMHCGVTDTAIANGLKKFQGTGRRFQIYEHVKLNSSGEVLLIDDYGHHPREIEVTIDAVRKAWPLRRLVHVFQPHRYTRTQDLFADFVKVLSRSDTLVLLDIYPAGEQPLVGVSGEKLFAAICEASKRQCYFLQKPQQLTELLPKILQDQDILLIQGAGDIGKLAPQLAQGIK
jgi:UDP-N-acetylmuramate--alanine ligase